MSWQSVVSPSLRIFYYDAYGQLLNMDADEAATTLLYSGEQTDALTGQQYLRDRYYDTASGRFNRLDPFSGNAFDPQSFHKYAYVHGDPISGVDPTGQFFGAALGLGGLLISTAIGGSVRGSKGSASASALVFANRAIAFFEYASYIQTIAISGSRIASGDYVGAVSALLGTAPDELDEILKDFRQKGLADLAQTGLNAAIGNLGVDFAFSLPNDKKRIKKAGKIKKALDLVLNVVGRSNRGQEFMGEIGTGLFMYAIGFELSGLQRPTRNTGPDYIFQHSEKTDLFSVTEAKGGTSTLKTSGLVRPGRGQIQPFDPLPGEGPRFEQMGKRWIEFWLRHYIRVNSGTSASDAGRSLRDAFSDGDPILALVSSLNLSRTEEVRIAARIFSPPRGSGFRDWPAGY